MAALIEVLTDLGMTIDRARVYSDRFSTSEYLVMVDGTDDEVRRAESILCKSYSSKVWGARSPVISLALKHSLLTCE